MLKSNHLEVFQSILLYSHTIYILPHDLNLQVSLTPGYMYAYRVSIQPSGCPRKINREIVKTMVEGYSQVIVMVMVVVVVTMVMATRRCGERQRDRSSLSTTVARDSSLPRLYQASAKRKTG